MLCLNYLNKTVELLFILYNFAIVPSVGTGIKAQKTALNMGATTSYPPWVRGLKLGGADTWATSTTIVPSVGTGIKAQNDRIVNRYYHIVPFVGTGIKAAEPFLAFGGNCNRTLHGCGD